MTRLQDFRSYTITPKSPPDSHHSHLFTQIEKINQTKLNGDDDDGDHEYPSL